MQRAHLEISLLCLSTARLCAALWQAGCPAAAAALAALTVLGLLVEEWTSGRLATPYAARAADSDGVTLGALAVPSALAAFVALDPSGGWLLWYAGSCGAAVATLCCFQIQALRAGRQAGGRKSGQSAAGAGGLAGEAPGAAAAATDAASTPAPPDGKQRSGYATRSRVRVRAHACGEPSPHSTEAAAVEAAGTPAKAAAEVAGQQNGSSPNVKGRGGRSRNSNSNSSSSSSSSSSLSVSFSSRARRWGVAAAAAACAAALAFASLGAHPGGRDWPASALAAALALAAPPALDALMRRLPRTLSLGEGALAAQGALLAAAAGLRAAPALRDFARGAAAAAVAAAALGEPAAGALPPPPEALLPQYVALVVAATLAGSWAVCAVGRGGRGARAVAGAAALASAAVLALLGAWTLLVLLPSRPHGRGALLLAYWAALLAACLPLMRAAARRRAAPQIVLRKGYHLLAIALFAPALAADAPLLAASLAVAFAALAAAELARVRRAPLIGAAVQEFMQDFVDARDAGPLYVTHFTLLLGLAVPVWLAAGLPQGGGAGGAAGSGNGAGATAAAAAAATAALVAAARARRAALSGLLVIGVGDTLASAVGRAVGRAPVHAGSRKTLEGTAAGAAGTLAAWRALAPRAAALGGAWAPLACATAGACLLEAATCQLDNALIPLWYLPHCALAGGGGG